MTEQQRQQLERLQKQLGDRGEDYVLRYERQRLATHPQVSSIRIIGRTDVGMGYDILSFQGITSQHHDRYIEVKTYSVTPHFFLSPGEQAAARKYGTQYCLYLVDATQLSTPAYQPIIIPDPINNLDDQWIEKTNSREFMFVDDTLSQLPDDLDTSTVLVGCFNTKDHLNWILRTHYYNVRQGAINGSVSTNEMTTTPRYLLLYDVRNPRTYRLYAIDSSKVVSRAEMYAMSYPNPHANSYMLYHLKERLDTLPVDILALLRVHNDKLTRTSGTPVYISGAILRKYIIGGPTQQGISPNRIYTNERKPWTAIESAKLTALYTTGTTIPVLAHEFFRPVEEITAQLRLLNLMK